jgi:hypothetical protein
VTSTREPSGDLLTETPLRKEKYNYNSNKRMAQQKILGRENKCSAQKKKGEQMQNLVPD